MIRETWTEIKDYLVG